jgi:predicted Kef-type K+ transport protein
VIKKNPVLGGYLLLAAGCAFVAAYVLGKQLAMLGVSAALFGIGAAFVAKAKRGTAR